MTKTTVTTNGCNDKQYRTRYGVTTANAAAYDLLDRTWARLRFLEEMFTAVNQHGEGFTLDGYSHLGLAAILEDLAIDVYDAHSFYTGSEHEPGNTGEAPAVRS